MVAGDNFLRRGLPLAAALVLLLAAAPAGAGENAQAATTPYFASLRFDRINLRVGPGRTYPIRWVLTRKGLPVEVLRHFENWRKIRDFEGDEGWVQESMVTSRRTVIVTGKTRALHAQPDRASALVARAERGVVAKLLRCQGAWCRIKTSGITGWVEGREVWGVSPDTR